LKNCTLAAKLSFDFGAYYPFRPNVGSAWNSERFQDERQKTLPAFQAMFSAFSGISKVANSSISGSDSNKIRDETARQAFILGTCRSWLASSRGICLKPIQNIATLDSGTARSANF
jgi:hypothetical protein